MKPQRIIEIPDEIKVAVFGAELCDALPAAVLVIDTLRNVLYANTAAEALLGFSRSMLEGKPLSEVLVLNDEWHQLLQQAAAYSQGVVGRELPLQWNKAGKSSSKVNVHINACKLSGIEENSQIVMLIPCDVNDKLGGQALQKHVMRSASVMSEILAHEVRNPLSGIRGAAQLLEHGVSGEDRPLVDLIRNEVDRIGHLLNQVEYFSCSNPIKTSPLNIHEVLRYVVMVAKQGFASEVVIEEQYDPSLPLVQGNRELLIQALLNLIKNAAEALKDNPYPRIVLHTTYRSGYRVVNSNNEVVALPICVQVQDNGPGISVNLRQHIFDPFVTDKPSGKGLGLPIVAKIAANHQGVVLIEDTEAGLTTFSLLLPAAKE